MVVPAQDEVDPAGLERRQEVLAGMAQAVVDVGIIERLAVGRVVPVGDDPLAARGGQVAA